MPKKTSPQLTIDYVEEIADELAVFFFDIWKKRKTLFQKNNEVAALPVGSTHKGGLPTSTTAT